jgi:hypothetical protein
MLAAMDLRDRLAARFAASLVATVADPAELARRAYDLAEAMLAERARRIDADEGRAIALEPRRPSLAPPALDPHGRLLDEPEPMFEPEPRYDEEIDTSWIEQPYDPSWDLEARWIAEPASRPPGPGIARTRPDEAEDEAARRQRSA